MIGRRSARVGLGLLGIVLAAGTAGSAPTAGAQTGLTEIDRVVVIIEQDHTFDAYFGDYPDGPGQGDPTQPAVLTNGREAAFTAYNSGRQDRFEEAQRRYGHDPEPVTTRHNRETAPVVWQLADDYVLFDNYHSSTMGGSLSNALHLMAGTDDGFAVSSKQALGELATASFPTIFDQLEAADVPWSLYVGRLDEIDPDEVRSGGYVRSGEPTPASLYWAPVLAMNRFWSDPDLAAGVTTQDEFYRDAAAGRLPAVSFVVPRPTDQPAGGTAQGQRRLQSLVNAVAKTPGWESTAVFVVWDDWGGYADEAKPPTGLGFRVPMLLVSPLAHEGHVSSRPHDHTSIVDFITNQFGLEPLTPGAPASAGFDDAFDLERGPVDRGLVLVETLDPTPVGTPAENTLTLGLYVAALATAGVLLMVVLRRERAAARTRGGAWLRSTVGSS